MTATRALWQWEVVFKSQVTLGSTHTAPSKQPSGAVQSRLSDRAEEAGDSQMSFAFLRSTLCLNLELMFLVHVI